jgi:CubicO group peptidase (beta-lactamase class C family)
MAGPATLFHAASTAEGVASSVAHVLVERGELDYDMRAVNVWPEFGAHGKDRVTLRHVLLHTAGVPAPPYDTTVPRRGELERQPPLVNWSRGALDARTTHYCGWANRW